MSMATTMWKCMVSESPQLEKTQTLMAFTSNYLQVSQFSTPRSRLVMIASQLAPVTLTCGLRILHVDLGMRSSKEILFIDWSKLKYYVIVTTIL